MPLDTHDASLISIHAITPRVKQYLLRVDGHTFDYQPGQHTSIVPPFEDHTVARPYSPVNLPGTDTIALAIKRYEEGTVSTWMDERAVGDTVPITDVKGNLHIRDFRRDVVFLSTGTGITPMLAMLKAYLRRGEGTATFVYGERTQDDLMYRETLDQLRSEHAQLQVGYVLSHEEWTGPTGFVQHHLDRFADTMDAHFYLCGVPAMVVATEDELEDRGVAPDDIFVEGWEHGAVDG